MHMAPTIHTRRVLVVEDDVTSREYLRLVLQKNSYEVICAEGMIEAQQKLTENGFDEFACVITDYRMPEHTGLELLNWLRGQDRCISTIILTSEGEKDLVAESLRSGATDFLDKPMDPAKLVTALDRAITQTEQQRHMAMSESAVQKLGRAQSWMVQTSQSQSADRSQFFVDVCYHPKLEAGGDFFSHFQPTPLNHCFLLTDVSGHDLEAAYISAYFQGIVRGMLQKSAPVLEIFRYFNLYLVKEWNHIGEETTRNIIETSLAASAVLVDCEKQTADVFISGAPPPIYVSPDGRVKNLGRQCGAPLGWFDDLDLHSETHPINDGGIVYLWTDGLEDLADSQNVHPLCMGFVLLQARAKKRTLPELDFAQDDILFASILIPSQETPHSRFLPILAEQYNGSQTEEIDKLVTLWRRNLKVALPNLDEAVEYNILLASREATLNAMEHGCCGSADKPLRFQISFDPDREVICVWVDDCGRGHNFDINSHFESTSTELIEEHRGLIFILNLAHPVRFERNGASVIMEFSIHRYQESP